MFLILSFLGAVALGAVGWCVRREVLRRRQIVRVRAALEPRVSVAELRDRCDADALPRYPAARGAAA